MEELNEINERIRVLKMMIKRKKEAKKTLKAEIFSMEADLEKECYHYEQLRWNIKNGVDEN